MSYNSTCSLVRFKQIKSKLKNALVYYNTGIVVVNLEFVGLGTG
jgi:hypothetical protein